MMIPIPIAIVMVVMVMVMVTAGQRHVGARRRDQANTEEEGDYDHRDPDHSRSSRPFLP
jgi:hypothetical protein